MSFHKALRIWSISMATIPIASKKASIIKKQPIPLYSLYNHSTEVIKYCSQRLGLVCNRNIAKLDAAHQFMNELLILSPLKYSSILNAERITSGLV